MTHIRISDIDIPDRLRPTDDDYVAGLADSMDRIGQTDPILVRPVADGRYQLVAGAHRLAAAGLIGWSEIDCTVREMDDLQARLAEIDENLIRRELSPIDRAIFLSERKAVYEQLHPNVRRGGDRKSTEFTEENQTANLAVWFSQDVAERIGISERTTWRAIGIVQALGRDTLARLRRTPLASNQSELEKLAKLPEERRGAVVNAIAAGTAKSVREALSEPPPDRGDVIVQKLIDLWSRAGRDERKRFLAHVGIAPAEAKRVLDDWMRRKSASDRGQA
jgi:ParB family chromosome partitioning protein